jgi:hypothetical protein
MTNAPLSVIFVPVEVPGAGSPRYARQEKPKTFRHHRAQRDKWPLRQDIPCPHEIDRRLIDEMRDQAKKAIADSRGQIEALLGAA